MILPPMLQNAYLTLLGLTLCSIFNLPIATGFVTPSQHRIITPHPSPIPISPTPRLLANLFSPESDEKESTEFDGFNPFQPGSKIKQKGGFGILPDERRKRPPRPTPGGQISPRQMRMTELTTALLLCLSDEESVSELLRSNEGFLLEQLNDPDAVLEADSVYAPGMDRGERFRRYREVMGERIEGARAPVAKKALGALMDFVLSRE